jgi:hypothetical protein
MKMKITAYIFLAILFIGSTNPMPSDREICQYLDDLVASTGKKGGCIYGNEALVLMDAYEIVRETSLDLTIPIKAQKRSKIAELLKGNSCSLDRYILTGKNVEIFVGGGINTKREVPAIFYALEMMTENQKSAFFPALDQNVKDEYVKWKIQNVEIQEEIHQDFIQKKALPLDIDGDIQNLFISTLDDEKDPVNNFGEVDKSQFEKLLLNKEFNERLMENYETGKLSQK